MILRKTLEGVVLSSALFMLIAGSAPAAQRYGKDSSLKTLVNSSDLIVIGKCSDKKVNPVGRIIETDYEVKVGEVWKGDAAQVGKTLTLTVAGGDLTTPPISMLVPGHAHLYAGEEVALFLNTKPPQLTEAQRKAVPAQSKLSTTARVTGGYEGKFSVFKSDVDGKMKITRLNLENYGYNHNDRVLERLIHAIAQGNTDAPTGAMVDLGGGAYTTPEGKTHLDEYLANQGVTAASVAPAAAHPADTKPTASGLPAVQDLDDFKASVQGLLGR
jgi:hypothetical protein